MKVMVTGGAGFIGSHIVDALVACGDDVVVVDNLSAGVRENVNRQSKFYEVDINDKELGRVFRGERPEIVFHQAAQTDVPISVGNPFLDAQVNILGTLNLLNCCIKSEVRKIIYASSAAVYGIPRYLPVNEDHPVEPISNYGVSKLAGEHYLRAFHLLHGIEYTVLRYANVYGPRQGLKGEGGVICIFANNLVQGQAVNIYGDGRQTRDFVFVEDVVRANLAVLEKGDGMTLNVGSGMAVSVKGLVESFNKLTGQNLTPCYRKTRPGDIEESVFDTALAKGALGWEAQVELAEGLRRTLDYYQHR